MKRPRKIGILTYHFSENFGAALQAYALRTWLLRQGHHAEFVNYCPAYVEHGGNFLVPSSKRALRANLKIAYLRLSAMRQRLWGNRDQLRRFGVFRLRDLGVVGPALTDAEALHATSLTYDLLICGSDQIWSPSIQRGLDEIYFLRFGSSRMRRISYAASFGGAKLADLQTEGASGLLNGLDSISVREESGMEFVRLLTGRAATLVVDPTFLLRDYENLLEQDHSNGSSNGHVFCYALRTDYGVRTVASELSHHISKPIVAPQNPHSRWRPLGLTTYPCPRQWLSQLAHADFVVTNSFHGTVFSIIFERPFLTVGLPATRHGLNDRMTSLLKQAGLMDRFLVAPDSAAVKRLAKQPIDWPSVRQRISALRDSSVKFLNDQIDLVA